MTPRPALASKSRPLSAIFIGSAGSTPPTLPDLPEPPSPSTSSNASGLPSPPATNSTGSGSVGGGSTNAGSIRHRTPSSKTSSDMFGGVGDRYFGHKKRSSVLDDEDDADENENDEDQTARLSDDRRRSFPKAASDNQTALQRVKNLTQRNRMVLDKLSSISRGSPVPSNHSRSPMSPPTAGSSSSSAASSSRYSSLQTRPQSVSSGSSNSRIRESRLSGSETERDEPHHSNQSMSSDGRSGTPPPLPDIHAPESVRQRRISAPASPGKVRRTTRDRDRGPSPGPSRASRNRVSTTLSVDEGYGQYRSDDEDVTAAALAAVASSRRDPGSSGKKGRQPLPREFRERKISDERPIGEPTTPHRHSSVRNDLGRASPSPRKNRATASDPPASPRRLGQARYSTVRDLTRKHQTRWMSEDLSSPSRDNNDDSFESITGRRQGHRAGSSEGLLGTAGGRSLVGEGLRAAGLAKRRDEDVFSSNGDPQAVPPRRTRSTGNSSVIAGGHSDGNPEQARDGRSSRVNEGVGPPQDPKTPFNGSYRFTDRRAHSGGGPRPGTSMAALHHETHDMAPRGRRPPHCGHTGQHMPSPTEWSKTCSIRPIEIARHRPPSAPSDRALLKVVHGTTTRSTDD
ncbi:hypothetical protein BD413DRAFT_672974 [Trametes elegans]|nr:hypothetical protein BD413DRAFT_672974 [Trametes elegans]